MGSDDDRAACQAHPDGEGESAQGEYSLILPRPQTMTSTHALHLRNTTSRPEPPAEKQRRAGRPKVRTGCQTCKIRHVKCDERKPTCVRCESVNVTCQGYPMPVARRRKPAPAPTRAAVVPPPIAPRSMSPLLHVTAPRRPQPARLHLSLPFPRGLSLAPKVAAENVVYFDYFRHQVANNLAGFYTTSIWSRLVTGDGMQDDCVHHSILAIGAFMRSVAHTACSSVHDRSSAISRKLMVDKVTDCHHQKALQHYVKAVTSFRQRIQYMALSSPAAVVTTTLLLVVFELLQGKQGEANTLLNSAIALLGDFVPPDRAVGEVSYQRSSDHNFKEVEWVLPVISITNHLSHLLRPLHHSIDVFQMDTDFYLPEPSRDSMSRFFTSWGRFFTFSIVFLRQSMWCGLETMSADALLPYASLQKLLVEHLQKWKTIIAEYANSSHLGPTKKTTLRLAKLHWTLLHITINCCLDIEQVMYDDFDAEFRELIMQCVDLIRDNVSQQRPTSVLLGGGIILPLATAVRFCRNHDIRLLGAQIARHIPLSMVAWNVQELVNGLLGGVLLEELGRNDDGFIPPKSRWFWLKDEYNHEKGKSEQEYQRLTPDEKGERVRKNLRFPYDLLPEICNAAGCTNKHTEYKELVPDQVIQFSDLVP